MKDLLGGVCMYCEWQIRNDVFCDQLWSSYNMGGTKGACVGLLLAVCTCVSILNKKCINKENGQMVINYMDMFYMLHSMVMLSMIIIAIKFKCMYNTHFGLFFHMTYCCIVCISLKDSICLISHGYNYC